MCVNHYKYAPLSPCTCYVNPLYFSVFTWSIIWVSRLSLCVSEGLYAVLFKPLFYDYTQATDVVFACVMLFNSSVLDFLILPGNF
ncbi:hypothetical protein FKM82_019405 [Ascaphus truei]